MITGIATSWAQQKLVLYYSENGTTKTVAEEIQKQLGADIEAVEAVEPYTGDFQATVQRGNKERQNGEWPAIKPLKSDLSKYDVIFLGYPIWYGTYANPIVTLLNGQDFAGKTIVPFCTFGSGGLNTSSADLKKALPKAKIAQGYGVRTARVAKAAKELDRFLTENGYKISAEGEDVLFIEFGTGDRAGVLSPLYDEVPADARPGSWSETHAQQYSTQGFWYFGGKRYEFTEPHPAFYDAYQAMVEALPQIAQEVFGK